ncbi:MAG TPA: type II toxin-antitoxin system RelE/ParE family toxin [Thiobacillus sp.]|nr:type II toxin-antitoxin system RelE/ParE family toxin [Thiobacillus sp.]
MQVSLSHETQADASAAVDWYINEKTLAAANDFASKLGHALTLLSQFPELGESGSLKTRMLPLQSFPYSLIYRLHHDQVRVITVAHHSRRPGHWVRRR